ncbi:MAG: hypothetical protein LBT82_00375, partial [Oscillospiraceae bacterium]|nr:hypothetical protein [Oscillospiraceae bacterium]
KQLTPNQTIKFVNNDLIPLAKEYGYNFNLKDYLNLIKKENTAKLSEEELLSAAGGGKFSLKALSLAGAIILSGASSLANVNLSKDSSKPERAILSNASSRRRPMISNNQNVKTKVNRKNQSKISSKNTRQLFRRSAARNSVKRNFGQRIFKPSSQLVSFLPIGLDASLIKADATLIPKPSHLIAAIESIVRSVPREKLLTLADELSKETGDFPDLSISFSNLIKDLSENNTTFAHNSANDVISKLEEIIQNRKKRNTQNIHG